MARYPDFVGTANVPRSAGWKAVFNPEAGNDAAEGDEDENNNGLGSNAEPFVFEGANKRPEHPSMKWLMKQLEKRDVGTGATRTSTYSEVTSTTAKYPLLSEQGRNLTLAQAGEMSWRLLPGTHIGDLSLTEKVYQDMRDIADGKTTAEACLRVVADWVREDITTMQKNAACMRSDVGLKETQVSARAEGSWLKAPGGPKKIAFKKIWARHEFSDDEVTRLLAGETISFEATNKAGKPYTATGALGLGEFMGRRFVGFQPEVPDKPGMWSGRTFAPKEIDALLAGQTLEIDDFVSARTGRNFGCRVNWDAKAKKIRLGLRDFEVKTFVSHSSLSVDARRQAEAAFSQARNCVLVSTSTLELGIDVGDLDRAVQIGAPRTVASVLQRLGRTGRRPGTERNMLFLSTDDAQFLRACGLLLLWSEGYVEPVTPPPTPLHVAAQQLLGLALQERRIGANTWDDGFSGLGLASPAEWQEITAWLVETGHLDSDQGMLFMGPEAERKYGGIHYRDLMAVFTADPQVVILHGREEIGSVDPMVLHRKVDGPRLLTLGGRAWQVNYVDWKRHRAYVEPSANAADSKWSSLPQPESYALSDATRRVLLGATPADVLLSKRALTKLDELREEYSQRVMDGSTVLLRESNGRLRWWTWAGARANAVLAAGLLDLAPALLDESRAYNNWQIGLRGDTTASTLAEALSKLRDVLQDELQRLLPQVDERALRTLKFAELLPPSLAAGTLAERNSDHAGAAAISTRQLASR